MSSPRLLFIATLLSGALAAPAVAGAATITVSGDDGNPVAVPPGAGPTVRNMRPDVGVGFPNTTGRYQLAVTGPTGTAASTGVTCIGRSFVSPSRVNYAGNGAYTVTVTNYGADDSKCATPTSTETFTFTIAASTALTAPAQPFVLRAPGSFTTAPLLLPIALNPGADSHEVRFAPNAQIGPDGAIVGASAEGSVDTATGMARLNLPGPGVYTVVARATRFTSAGEIGSPWSPPVQAVVRAPFDIRGGLSFLDSRGPSYSVRFELREKTAVGRVSVAISRRGSKNRYGKYRSLGTAKISSISTISKRFRAARFGLYHLRFRYAGRQTILPGSVVFTVRVTRRFGSSLG